MRILGLGGLDHNGSATLSVEGQIQSFLELERPSRRKNVGLEDEELLGLVLSRLNVTAVEAVAVADETFWHRRKSWLEPALRRYCRRPADVWPHHDCHLASALVFSPWDRTLCVSIDGKGDDLSAKAAIVSRGQGIEDTLLEVSSAHSLGRLWWAVSEFCGFPGHHSAGKTMALAAFGEPFDLFGDVLHLQDDGSFGFVPRKTHPDTFRQVPRICQWITDQVQQRGLSATNSRADVAASLQDLTCRVASHLVGSMVERCGIRQVCLAGGVALNCVMNQALTEDRIVDELFVVPCCDDRGLSLGAAALTSAEHAKPISIAPNSPFLGPAPSDTAPNGWEKTDETLESLASDLAAGAIVAWFTGADEAGPRALGHRSLLATPTDPEMRDRLNAMKGREDFRPFGCAVDSETTEHWFPSEGESPFMLRVIPGSDAARSALPSALHEDGTSRIQTVRPGDGSSFGPLLTALAAIGHPKVVLNTSLNGPGEPLAHTVRDAAEIATRLGVDRLMIDDSIYKPAPHNTSDHNQQPKPTTTEPFYSPVHDQIGGIPELLGPWQLKLLRLCGLQSTSRLLDLGCGTLRGGLHFIRFLNPNCYFGADPNEAFLRTGSELVREARLADKKPSFGDLVWVDGLPAAHFDFILTQSVLNHLSMDAIFELIDRVRIKLAPDGQWIGTAQFDGDVGTVSHSELHPTRPDEYVSTTMNPSWFATQLDARGLALNFDLDMEHPRGLIPFRIRHRAQEGCK